MSATQNKQEKSIEKAAKNNETMFHDFLMLFQSNTYCFFGLQAFLRNFRDVIWIQYLLCLQHVGYFAETSKNRIAITFLIVFPTDFSPHFAEAQTSQK